MSRARPTSGPVVAVTGAARGLGLHVTTCLAADPRVGRVIGLDERRSPVAGVSWRVGDVGSPTLATRLSGVDALVHLAVDTDLEREPAARRAANLRAASAALTAAAAAAVRRVVLVTSGMVYGAHADNPVPLRDDAPLRAEPGEGVLGDLLEIERLAADAVRTNPHVAITLLRPATLAGPHADSSLTRHFEAPRLLVVRGSAPCWQFCHVDDFAAAVVTAVTSDLPGPLNVSPEGWLSQDDVERITGLRRIELPPGVAFATAERLHRLGITPAPAADLAFLSEPWVLTSERLRAAGWAPRHNHEAALRAQLTESAGHTTVAARRLGRRDATRAAAGAAVAVVGTAAIVRAARRRRRS